MGLQKVIIRRAPAWIRFYRVHLTLDWPMLLQFIPHQGTLLDVGCGAGYVDYALAARFPNLRIVAIDIDSDLIHLAREYNTARNIEYMVGQLHDVQGRFDCVMLIDVLHHVPLANQQGLLGACADRLANGGQLFIKDISRTRGIVSVLMDRYVSGANEVYMLDCHEMVNKLPPGLKVDRSIERYWFPFPHYYIQATRRNDVG